jgi:hypothetical protein
MTNLRNSILLLLAALALGGCLYEQPLTSTPSTDLDSRLLGVFQFSEKGRKKKERGAADRDEPDDVQRMAVLPYSEGKYLIYYRDYGKTPVETLTFIGWISRVDESYYLTFRDETEGSKTQGRYGFLKFEWKWPGNFTLYSPDMTGFENALTPFAMRKALRAN